MDFTGKYGYRTGVSALTDTADCIKPKSAGIMGTEGWEAT